MIARDAVSRLLTLVVLGVCLAGAPAAFATNYICNCGPGADADCVPGSDSNSGTSPSSPLRTFEAARSAFRDLPAGGETRFCSGGSFGSSPVSSRWENYNCPEGPQCVIADYDAPWASGDEGRPILRQSIPGAVGFSFDNGGDARHTGNVLLENLDMRGDGTDGADAIFFYNDANDYTIRNLRIDSWKIGIHPAASRSCDSDDTRCNARNDRIFVYDSTITNNTNQGWLGRADNSGLFNNYWEGNGDSITLDHNIYFSNGNNFTISGNRLYRSAHGTGNECRGASLVAHGTIDNILVENNEIWEDVGSATPQCWGIALDNGYSSAESITNAVIRGNIVRNMGNVAIGVAVCQDCLIENNVVIAEQAHGTRGIIAPNRSAGPGDAETTRVTVRNNSIYFGAAADGTGISVGSTGNNHTIANNAIYYEGTDRGFSCMTLNSNTSVYDAVANNICYFPNSSGGTWASGIGSLSELQSRGLGQGSQNVNPEFSSRQNGNLSAASSSSPMVNGANAQLASPLAVFGAERDGSPDVGAYEYGVSTPNPRPTPTLAPPVFLE